MSWINIYFAIYNLSGRAWEKLKRALDVKKENGAPIRAGRGKKCFRKGRIQRKMEEKNICLLELD